MHWPVTPLLPNYNNASNPVISSLSSARATSIQEENKRVMLECIDHIHSEIQIRSRAIKEVAATFEAVQVSSLISATEEELKVAIPKLTTFYDELSERVLFVAIPRLRRHLKAAEINLEEAKDCTILYLLTFIV